MKGIRKLIKPLDSEGSPDAVKLKARDRHLAIRFYWHSHIRKMRLDYVYMKLEEEFYLAEKTITDKLMGDCSPVLDKLNRDRPTAKQLEEMVPHMKF